MKTVITALIGFLTACTSTYTSSNKQFDEISDFKLKLERTGCFGSCPSYIVEITKEGNVSYCGLGYVEQMGLKARQISTHKVRSLYDQVLAASFFSLRDDYRAMITDNPAYIVSVSLESRTKVIVDYVGHEVGMPVSVTEIQNSIDEAAEVSDWVGSIDEPNDGSIRYWQPQKCENLFE